ncbi:nucleoside recognition protein [Acuticoccus sp. MNP-M23]|uniref:nucleoside recognition domain-containing protein n=1 Tax=Acuticoccus sp. MNP-M23 TaxID=3072793 RepID=UPI00281498C9|nr:nucleoside recognition domain-containing protein [Acuticoccus sp. MNP-M23]WMS44329.1 nucleoside recognition protein [Acuticoccus sp. MNP-M23]
MTTPSPIGRITRDILAIYWELARIIVPIAILAKVLTDIGAIKAIAPWLSGLMGLFGLPPEMAIAWLSALLVGIWAGVTVVFTVLAPGTLTEADMTVFAALILFAHALPVEQRIIQKAGPGLLASTAIRLVGGMAFAFILHHIFRATGWLSAPLDPLFLPDEEPGGWISFAADLGMTLVSMFVILFVLTFAIEGLKHIGAMAHVDRALSPLFRVVGIGPEAASFTTIGMLLGIAFGGGLLIREARRGTIPPRQIFLSCAFMGLAHGIIEDTIVVAAAGADVASILLGRLAFAMVATALIGLWLAATSDATFYRRLFRRPATS